MKNYHIQLIIGANLSFSAPRDIVIFRLVGYLVFGEFYLFNTTNLILNLTYIRFGIILIQFLSISRDRHIR